MASQGSSSLRSCSRCTCCSTATISASPRSRRAIARGRSGARRAMASIGPFWNGNEVWLIAARRGALCALSRRVRLVVLGLLSSVHRRALAADVSRHRAGAARAFFVGALASVLGRGLLALERAPDPALRRRAREPAARRAARYRRVLSGHVRISAQSVRVARRRVRAVHARAAWRGVCDAARRRRARRTRAGAACCASGGSCWLST